MADLICQATRRVCYASPGIQLPIAKAKTYNKFKTAGEKDQRKE